MTIGYRPSDLRIGSTPAVANPIAPYGYAAPVPWVASTTWAALSTCTNNGFLFRTVAGGAGNTSGDGPSQASLTDASCTWVAVGPLNSLYGQDAAATLPVGTVVKGVSPDFGEGEFIYVKFSGTVAAGDACVYDTYAGTCVVQPTSFVNGLEGIAMAAQASGTYGYLMIRGIHGAGSVLNGVAAGGLGNSAATAGRLIAATTSNTVFGANLRLAPVGALNYGIVEVRYPVQTKTTGAA